MRFGSRPELGACATTIISLVPVIAWKQFESGEVQVDGALRQLPVFSSGITVESKDAAPMVGATMELR